jgi:hypothetical protein
MQIAFYMIALPSNKCILYIGKGTNVIKTEYLYSGITVRLGTYVQDCKSGKSDVGWFINSASEGTRRKELCTKGVKSAGSSPLSSLMIMYITTSIVPTIVILPTLIQCCISNQLVMS